MPTLTKNEKGEWIKAKEYPYLPCLLESIKCFLGFHEWRESERYIYTEECIICGKRKITKKII